MGHKFAEIAFTPKVKELQAASGSRKSYARMEAGADTNAKLGEREISFIAARDSFYMASVGETGWPYMQHRGGPPGFVHVIDEQTLGFADFRGNRQYVSVGNLLNDNRVSLFFMDYRNRKRLKLFGRVKLVDSSETDILDRLTPPDYPAHVERGVLVTVAGFDWNCPQHITPRVTLAEFEETTAALHSRIAELEAGLAHSPV